MPLSQDEIVVEMARIIQSVLFPVTTWSETPEPIKTFYLHISRAQFGWLKTQGLFRADKVDSGAVN